MDKGGRFPSLDGLRAISVMLVLIDHSAFTFGFPAVLLTFYHPIYVGYLGVRVFFVISGFIISTLLIQEYQERGFISLSAFYKRRILRIVPAFYCYILFIFIMGCVNPSLKYPWWIYVAALTFTTHFWTHWSGFVGNPGLFLGHAWSLSAEEQFYLLWPACLVFFGPASRLLRPLVAAVICFALFFRVVFIHYCIQWLPIITTQLFVTNVDSIMFGCLLALAFKSQPNQLLTYFNIQPALMRLAAAAIIVLPFLFRDKINFIIGPTLQSPAIAYLIGSYIMVPSGLGYSILNLPWLAFMGRLSYSIYIWQQFFLASRHTEKLYWFQMFPQNLLFLCLAALFSFYVIERPFLKIKTRFNRSSTTPLSQDPTRDVNTVIP
jgi:peptidoglycan/LPS O-acetylase OafA/YrhL